MRTLTRRIGAALALALAGWSAQASTISYQFNATEVARFGAGPFGSVTLNQSGNNVNVTVALRQDMDFVNTGGPHSVFAFNARNVQAADVFDLMFNGISGSELGFTVQPNGANAPFGTAFSLMIDCTGSRCRNGAPGATKDPLSFTIADSVLADFGFLAEGTRAFFAADVICRAGSCDGATGAVGANQAPGGDGQMTVSEPSQLALMGLALLGVGAGASRRRTATTEKSVT